MTKHCGLILRPTIHDDGEFFFSATQLQALENAYARKAEEETQKYQQSLDDRLSEYQRDLEARYKKQLETEMNLFQTKELVKARLEERERYQREALKEREEAQQKHQHRLDDLRRNELQLKERYCKKEQVSRSSFEKKERIPLRQLTHLSVHLDFRPPNYFPQTMSTSMVTAVRHLAFITWVCLNGHCGICEV